MPSAWIVQRLQYAHSLASAFCCQSGASNLYVQQASAAILHYAAMAAGSMQQRVVKAIVQFIYWHHTRTTIADSRCH